jgi:hypothetical protein
VDLAAEADEMETEAVRVDLWQRPADGGVGIAVLMFRGRPASLRIIPVCGCGERGCAHAGRQLSGVVDGSGLLSLIDLLEGLDVSGRLRENEPLWNL